MEFLKVHKLGEDEDHFRTCKKRRGSGRPRRLERIVQVEREDEGSDSHLKEASAPNDGIQVDEAQTPSTHRIVGVFDCL